MENKASWVYGAAAAVALCAALMLIVAFLVTDEGVAEDVRGPAVCTDPDMAPARPASQAKLAAPARLWM